MTKRVLIVDDNRQLAENLAEILEDEGYSVRVFDCAEPALLAAGDAPFDAALVDVCMPGMDGVELHDRLRALRPSATFVLMSAFTSDPRLSAALQSGVYEVQIPGESMSAETHLLIKPFAPGSLLALIEAPVADRPEGRR